MRLNDADALLAKFKEHRDLYAPSWEVFKYSSFGVKSRVDEIDTCMADVINAPSVDAVEVVRCKECKHCEHGYKCRLPLGAGLYDNEYIIVDEDDFCSYGERKDNDKNG